MIAAVAGVLAFVGLAVAWTRFSAGRSERHSVKNYEHALGVLGGVAKRGESAPHVAPADEEIAKPHVRPSEPQSRRSRQEVEPPPKARVRLTPPFAPSEPAAPAGVAFGASEPAEDRAEPPGTTDGEELVPSTVDAGEAGIVLSFDDVPEAVVNVETSRRMRRLRPGQPYRSRRVFTGAAAAVVIAALGIVGWQLALNRSPNHSTGSRQSSGTSHHTTKPTIAPKNQIPSSLDPTSTSTSASSEVVAYSVPLSAPLSITFQGIGRCWLGVQQALGGDYLWMDTLSPGETASYSAQGAVVVYIGAPGEVSIAVNGIPVSLPADLVKPYHIALTPETSTST